MDFIDYIKVSVPAAITIILVIYASGIDLQTTYTDVWISGTSDKLGIKKSAAALTVWINDEESTTEDRDSQPITIVPIRISNSGIQSIGSDNRKWKLIIKTRNRTNIKLREIIEPRTDLNIVEVDELSKDRIGLQFGLFYPGESVEILVELPVSGENALKVLSAEANLPVEPKITITRYGPEPGPITKYGNIVFLSSLIILGFIYFVIGLSDWFEYQYDKLDWHEWLGVALVSVGILGATIIHAVAVTKLILLVSLLFL